MKKLLFAASVVCALCLSACDSNDMSKSSDSVIKNARSITDKGYGCGHSGIYSVKEFEYNNHKYVCFYINGAYGGSTGIVHDPDCWCWDDNVIYD